MEVEPLLLTLGDINGYRYLSFHLLPFRLFYHDPLLGLQGIGRFCSSIIPVRSYRLFISAY